MSIKRMLIANRGEIAVRIIRAAKAMGIHTIQAHSEADVDMLAVRLADEAVCIGPAQAVQSYLDIEAVVAAAKATKADAVTALWQRTPNSYAHWMPLASPLSGLPPT